MVMVEAVPVVLNNEVEKEMPVGMVAIPTSTSKELVSAIVTSDAQEAAIHVRAYVDGRSHLSIKGNTVQWLHLDNAAPGRLNDYPIINDHPTFGFAPKVLVESKVISLNQKSGANVVHLILTLYASSLGSPSSLR